MRGAVLASLVLTNLLYLAGAVVVATVVIVLYMLRHRKPRSMEAGIESFNRELRALSPEYRPTGGTDTRTLLSQPPDDTEVRVIASGGDPGTDATGSPRSLPGKDRDRRGGSARRAGGRAG